MKHINTGSSSHSNTGYSNHTNTYGNHTDSYHQVSDSYQNHNQNYYNNYYDYRDYSEYGDYGEYSAWRSVLTRNARANSYSNYKQNIHTQSYYTQSGSKHTNTGGVSHSNTGYTNHINVNTNIEPTKIGFINKFDSVYYKDNIHLVWGEAIDNNKCISIISSTNDSTSGIYENDKRIIPFNENGVYIAYYNSNGDYVSFIHKNTHSNINLLNELKNFYNNIPSNSYVCIGTNGLIANSESDINTIFYWLKTLFTSVSGFNLPNGYLFGINGQFSGILLKGSKELASKLVKLGSNTQGTSSVSYTINNVKSGQPLKYKIEYAFAPVSSDGNKVFGNWIQVGETSSLSFDYNLSSHGNGFIKFRIKANDSVEDGQYLESDTVRVLKYNKPNVWVDNKIITASEVKAVSLELKKLSDALGMQNTMKDFAIGDNAKKDDIRYLRNKINSIKRELSLGQLADSNEGIIYKDDINNIKKNIDKI